MINYSLPEFLGIFLIFVPTILFLNTLISKGFYSFIQPFFDYKDKEEIFHHHIHYKDKTRRKK